MAVSFYNPPGTTISVVRRTATPIVGSPDLAALCVGNTKLVAHKRKVLGTQYRGAALTANQVPYPGLPDYASIASGDTDEVKVYLQNTATGEETDVTDRAGVTEGVAGVVLPATLRRRLDADSAVVSPSPEANLKASGTNGATDSGGTTLTSDGATFTTGSPVVAIGDIMYVATADGQHFTEQPVTGRTAETITTAALGANFNSKSNLHFAIFATGAVSRGDATIGDGANIPFAITDTDVSGNSVTLAASANIENLFVGDSIEITDNDPASTTRTVEAIDTSSRLVTFGGTTISAGTYDSTPRFSVLPRELSVVGEDFLGSGIESGDVIVLTVAGAPVKAKTATIRSVDTEQLTITASQGITGDEVRRLGFEVHRSLGTATRPADIFISYVAEYDDDNDDSPLDDLIEIDDATKLATLFGEDSISDPRSGMPFGAQKMYENSAGRSFYVYGFKGDTDAKHVEARRAVEMEHGDQIPPIAIIAPQTSSKQRLDGWVNWARGRRANDVKKWARIVHQPTNTMTTVPIGDRVAQVQAIQALGATNAEYVTIMGTPTCYADVNDEQNDQTRKDGSKDTLCDGFHLAAAMAGLMSGNPIGGVLTRRTLAGFSRIGHANRYFTESQLDTIASGGITVLTQSTDSSPIVIRHALTTDRRDFKDQEINMSLARDWLAYTTDAAVSPLVAADNITANYLERITLAVEAVFTLALGLANQPFLNLTLTGVSRDTSRGGRVKVEYSIEQAEPANNIDVTIYY